MKFYSILSIIVFSLTTNIFAQVEFTTFTISTSADGASSVYAIDMDGDGDMDVLSASSFDNKIAWYANDGSGNMGTEQVISSTAMGAVAVAVADFDGDGDLDVVSASYDDDKIAWYANNGSGVFGAEQIITLLADGPMCSCGHLGHLEAFSSGTAIEKYVRDKIREGKGSTEFLNNQLPNSAEIAEAARAGNPLAKEAFDRAGYYLGIGVANLNDAEFM